ncbi:MAG: 50S ribosomal protein L32 [Phycisphaerales bacterium JB063]
MLPQQRQSRTKGRNRRSHDALSARKAVTCPSCGSAKLPHCACAECGFVRPGLKLSQSREQA